MNRSAITDPLEVVARLIQAIETGDVDAARTLYDPSVRIWHNTDGLTQTVAENLETLRQLVAVTTERRYDDVRRYAFDKGGGTTGVVEQHVLRATFVSGRTLELTACLVIDVVDGRITALDEYFDSAALSARSRNAGQ